MARAPRSAAPQKARRRAYHHGDLRRALLDAALALVEEEGLEALSLREVAKRAGVTHAAPYHHFADRAAVMAAIAHEGFDLLRDAMEKEAASARGPTARLSAIGRGYVRFALSHAAHFRVMFRPELAEWMPSPEESGRTAYDVLAEAIADCQAAGVAPKAEHDLLSVASWSLVHGLASLLLDGPLRSPPDPEGALVANRPGEALALAVPELFAHMFASAAAGEAPRRAPRRPASRRR